MMEFKDPDAGDPDFMRPSSKWRPDLRTLEKSDNRFWEVSVLFHLRDGFRSGDLWLAQSRRYGDLKQVLVPMAAAQEEMARLTMPLDPHAWLADRKARLAAGLKRLASSARNGTIPEQRVTESWQRIKALKEKVAAEAN